MAESFELKTIDSRKKKCRRRSQSSELIVQHIGEEHGPVTTVRYTLIKEYNFFVNENVSFRESKRQKQSVGLAQKSPADIINSELANMKNPITESFVTMPIYNCSDFIDAPKRSSHGNQNYYRFSKMKERVNVDDSGEYFDENGSPVFNLTSLCAKTRSHFIMRNDLLEVVYIPPLMANISNTLINSHKRDEMLLVDIQFHTFRFKYHHLFTLEEMLTECLKENFAVYENRHAINILQKIQDDLKINRNARDKIINELTKLNKSKTEIYLDSTLLKYNKRITDLRCRFYTERKKDNEILTKLLSLWNDIKEIRRVHSVVHSSLVLEVNKENMSEEEITETWNEMYHSEFVDELHSIEHLFAKELTENKNWKHNNKELLKKNNTDGKRTKSRLSIDEDKIKRQLEERLNILVPKETNILLKLKFDEDLVATEISNAQEIESRRKITKITYYFKISVDDMVVCESDRFQLNNNFHTNLCDIFSIQILPFNKFIGITLMENETAVSDIKIDINSINNYALEQETFNTRAIVDIDNYTVGSGNTLQDISKQQGIALQSAEVVRNIFYTKGELSLMLGWSNHIDRSKSTNNQSYFEMSNKIKNCLSFATKLDFDTLSDIITNVCDTKEELSAIMNIYNQLKNALNNRWFPEENNDIENSDNARYKLLNYRESEKLLNFKNSIIPLHSSQISTEQIQYLNSEAGILDQHYIPEEYHTMDMEQLDLQRYFGTKYIQILNKHIQKILQESMLETSYEDVVQDNESANPRTIISKMSNRKSPMNRWLNISCKHPSKSHLLQVTVLRAFCLPDRTHLGDVNMSPTHPEENDFIVKQLRPIVRVSYKEFVEQTSCAIGCNPSWNQTLHLSIGPCAPAIINLNIYDELKEDLTETYDSDDPNQNRVHYRTSHKWLGSLQIPLSAVHSVAKLQGAMKINTPPIILGYQNSVDTNLLHTLHDPMVPLHRDSAFIILSVTTTQAQCLQAHDYKRMSYLQRSEEAFIFRHLNDFLINYAKDFPSRVLSLTYFTTGGHHKCAIQFLQALPLPDLELLRRDLRTHTRRESAMSKSSSSSAMRSNEGRKSGPYDRGDSANTPRSSELGVGDRDSTQNTSDGRSVRRETNQLENVIHACARYVSLIPLYEPTATDGVTLMGWELLKILNGSPLDHTILLASYLLYLGVKCWIVCGMGLPRGFSSYVLINYDICTKRILLTTDNEDKSTSFYSTKHNTIVPYIYDATSGMNYDLRDACCPLKTIHYMYNDENIWINIQFMESCDSVRLDLTRSADWQPVFNKNMNVSKLPTISEHNLYASPQNADSLKQRIENKIKAKVQKWRSHRRTIWNRYCSSVLKESLPSWEYWSFNPATPKPAPSSRLKQLMSTYKIYGFPLNLPYTNMKRMLSNIKSTALFLSEETSVEFGLGVDVFCYPGQVCSVWLYLVSITRN